MNLEIVPLVVTSRRGRQSGVSLLIVLIMVMIIGITSAAAIRGAVSNEKVTNNIRVQNLAQQYAEAALRYCEAQLQLADAQRVVTLQEANIITVAVGGQSGWSQAGSWFGTAAGAAASRTSLPSAQVQSAGSSFAPSKLPECVVEKQTQSGAAGVFTYIITARGFSPDYRFNATTGETTAGSVVWLQSELFLQ